MFLRRTTQIYLAAASKRIVSIIWQTELILEEFPGLGLESVLAGYQEKYQRATKVLESWGNAKAPVFEPITITRHKLPESDSEKWERVSKAIRERSADLD